MAGKNKTERGFRLLWDDSGGTVRDLSASLVPGSISGGGITLDEVEMTGVSDSVKNYLFGHGNSEITATIHMNDAATTGGHTVVKATVGVVGTLTLQYGSAGVAPTTNDPEWEGEYILIAAPVALDGGKFVHQCRWLPSGAVAPAWGLVA